MRFKKVAVEVDAMQFTSNNEDTNASMDAIINWINEGKGKGDRHAWHNGTDIFIETLEGTMTAEVGDWIIKGVFGEFYPCKDTIFQATYEKVNVNDDGLPF